VLRFPLIHPPLLAALASAGHGARVLLADANYPHSTNVSPRAALIHLNLRPGLVTVDQVLEPLLAAVPIEAAAVMRPDDGSTPATFAQYKDLLGGQFPLEKLGRHQLLRRLPRARPGHLRSHRRRPPLRQPPPNHRRNPRHLTHPHPHPHATPRPPGRRTPT
jgi:L-fucose mutarotase